MGNFEKLSVLVIVVIIVMILVVALYTWTDRPDETAATDGGAIGSAALPADGEGTSLSGETWGGGGDPLADVGPVVDPDDVTLDGGDPLDNEDLFRPLIDPDPEDDPEAEPAKDDDAPGEIWEYTVAASDTLGLGQIASRELGSVRRVKDIEALNPGVDSRSLKIGTVLKMPPRNGDATPGGGAEALAASDSETVRPGGTYVARAGDTLERISKRVYGTMERWPNIFAMNHDKISNPDVAVPVGTVLRLPN